ncbi:HNH endonuclease [Arthrobacter sp. SRS-W-1-2016]|uniref:HNH endonuclease n=1 Tax=Arthrobacter sp. SRS-W-1-2016 TaxID=1930254 RepID=UPI00209B14C5|nr:HNH endonuclease [Arthrobacter sp. SRS-W-1-2016]
MTSASHETSITVPVLPATNFWWAIQSENFHEVFPDGTLWAPRRGSRGQRVASWETLHDARPGDVVLHFSRPEIRGISRVATMPFPASTPARGWREPPDTEGTLVLTDPLFEVRIPKEGAYGFLPPGQGPMTVNSTLNNGYFFPVDREAALQLLQHAGIAISDGPDQGRDEAVPAEQYLGGPSDRWALGAVRAEQGFLRNQQLQLRGSSCSLCGQKLPDEFLVAAHIKPRFACTEQERQDIRNVSMLACLFGCDALFERGYLVVGDYGTIEAGRPGPEPVGERIKGLIGRKCLAYDERSRGYFGWHRQTHNARQTE